MLDCKRLRTLSVSPAQFEGQLVQYLFAIKKLSFNFLEGE